MALIKDFDFSANQTTMSFFPVEERGNVTIVQYYKTLFY